MVGARQEKHFALGDQIYSCSLLLLFCCQPNMVGARQEKHFALGDKIYSCSLLTRDEAKHGRGTARKTLCPWRESLLMPCLYRRRAPIGRVAGDAGVFVAAFVPAAAFVLLSAKHPFVVGLLAELLSFEPFDRR